MALRVCSGCCEPLSPDSFHVNRARKDGLMAKCKECMKEYRKTLTPSPTARARAVLRTKRWRDKNPDTPVRRARTRDRERARYSSNPQHLARARIKNAAYRARKRGAAIEKIDPFEIFARDNWLCQLCGESVDPQFKGTDPRAASLDHIMPLSKGGTHERANVQLAHFGCNASKGNKIPEDLAP